MGWRVGHACGGVASVHNVLGRFHHLPSLRPKHCCGGFLQLQSRAVLLRKHLTAVGCVALRSLLAWCRCLGRKTPFVACLRCCVCGVDAACSRNHWRFRCCRNRRAVCCGDADVFWGDDVRVGADCAAGFTLTPLLASDCRSLALRQQPKPTCVAASGCGVGRNSAHPSRCHGAGGAATWRAVVVFGGRFVAGVGAAAVGWGDCCGSRRLLLRLLLPDGWGVLGKQCLPRFCVAGICAADWAGCLLQTGA